MIAPFAALDAHGPPGAANSAEIALSAAVEGPGITGAAKARRRQRRAELAAPGLDYRFSILDIDIDPLTPGA
jgi:hypothetical protein